MAKLIVILVLCAALFAALAVYSSGSTEVQVYSDPSQVIHVNVGQEFIVSLEENPSTGYVWYKEFDSSLLSLTEDQYVPPAEAMPGAAGTRNLEFKALNKGETEITLINRPSWWDNIPPEEQEETPVDTKVFTVDIC
jgi:predicted secreted protein